MNMDNTESMSVELGSEYAGQRLDKALAQELSSYSRGTIQAWIKQGFVQIQGQVMLDLRYKVRGDESINIAMPEMVVESEVIAENITLDVLHEDNSIIVINKPAGLVVHPAVGNRSGTLQNALLFHYPELTVVALLIVFLNLDCFCAHPGKIARIDFVTILRHSRQVPLSRPSHLFVAKKSKALDAFDKS